ncbi:zinc ribbon domain protein [bacterium BMS3Abin01]|nr:zinc ribbon domain protein [bacterium BMS3Abin01]
MPIYEYRCLKCGHQFEKLQNISDDAVKRCEKCGEQVTRLFHPVAVHFKGSGFYTTDYGKRSRSQEKPGEATSGKKEKKKSGKSSGDKPGD